ncbi:hypothetical protein M2324_001436 [Rhodovulum sulfidophilum]|nr:hypothetical protein [Rhodovulum sulfidophilum]
MARRRPSPGVQPILPETIGRVAPGRGTDPGAGTFIIGTFIIGIEGGSF